MKNIIETMRDIIFLFLNIELNKNEMLISSFISFEFKFSDFALLYLFVLIINLRL